MKEKKEGIVPLPNIKPTTFKIILDYMYSRTMKDCDDILDLLVAADFLKMDPLLKACESLCIDSIECKNAINLLKFANDHSLKLLKNAVIEFIVENISRFENLSSLSRELFIEIIKKKHISGKKLTPIMMSWIKDNKIIDKENLDLFEAIKFSNS